MRARNIKPGFFSNEDLAEVPPEGRLLFIGIWCLADREGKLEDRPKRIKGELFRFDDISVSKVSELLDHLSRFGLIIRYEVANCNYIKITNFLKHQKPHYNEKTSIIPEPILATKGESTSHQGRKRGQPREKALGPDSLNDDCLNDERGILKEEGSASPPPNGSGDALPPAYSCKHFEISQEFIDKLLSEFPGISPELLKAEISKAHDWLDDNPDRHKRRANGHLKNPRAFLKNWLSRVVISPPAQFQGPSGNLNRAEAVTMGNLAAAERLTQRWEEEDLNQG